MSEFCLISQLKMDLRFSNVRIPRTFSEIVLNFRLLRSIEIEIYIRIMKNRQKQSLFFQGQSVGVGLTQGQSVGGGRNCATKVFKNGRIFSWVPSLTSRMPAPDWAQKILCIIVPNRRTVTLESLCVMCSHTPVVVLQIVHAREIFILTF